MPLGRGRVGPTRVSSRNVARRAASIRSGSGDDRSRPCGASHESIRCHARAASPFSRAFSEQTSYPNAAHLCFGAPLHRASSTRLHAHCSYAPVFGDNSNCYPLPSAALSMGPLPASHSSGRSVRISYRGGGRRGPYGVLFFVSPVVRF